MQAAPTNGSYDRSVFPPGEKSSILSTIRFLRDPYGFFDAMYRRYGDPCTLWTTDGPMVMSADPELVRAIFTVDPDTVEPWAITLLSPFFGARSVIMTGGERHRRDRKLLTPLFNGSRMRAYGRIIIDAARKHTRAWKPGWTGGVHTATTGISLEVIVRAVFGIEPRGEGEQASAIVKRDIETLIPAIVFIPFLRQNFLGIGPWSRFARARQALDDLLYGEIASRRRSGKTGEDILSLIVAARYDDGSEMTDAEIHDQLITLLAAGHETTATALAWALYWTHRDPSLADQLRADIAALGPDPEPDAIAALPLLEATCTETLRLHPIVPDVARRLRAPMTLGRYTLPVGAGLSATISKMHSNPQLYPNPTLFDAKRFVGNKPPMFGYAPFGGGSRRCLGAAFATYEMKLVLATLLTSFDLELLDHNVVPFRRNVTMGPRGGVRMRVVKRRA
jgi:cytochrome P450 family 110